MALFDFGRHVVIMIEEEHPAVHLTLNQIATLTIICDEPGPHRIRVLARRLNVATPTIVRVMRQLEYYGLAQRVLDAADRRDRLLLPTEIGRVAREALVIEREAEDDAGEVVNG